MTALSRAFGIFFLVVIEPYRFFSGTDSFRVELDDDVPDLVTDDAEEEKDDDEDDDSFDCSSVKWSPLNMAVVYDALEKALMAGSVDGSFLMRPANRDIFMGALEPVDKVTYRAWQEHLNQRRTRRPGDTLAAQRAEIVQRVFEPTDDSDAVTDEECAEILKVVAINFLSGLYSSQAKHYFKSKDGKFSVDNQTPDMIRRMEGFLRTNDKGGESPIGTFKYVYEHMVNIGWLAANAVATARATHAFAIAAASSSDRGSYKDNGKGKGKAGSGTQKQPAAVVSGSFVALPERESDGLVRAARRDLTETKRSLKRTLAAQQARWADLAEVKREGDLNSVKAKFKNATIYHKKWVEVYSKLTSPKDLRTAVHAIPRKGKRLAFLKDYCKVGEHGLGFVEKGHVEHKAFSKKGDESVGTLADLEAYCVTKLLPATRSHADDIPDEAPLPPIPVRHLSALGRTTKQRAALQARRESRAAAMRLRWTREIDDDLEAGVGAARSRESNMPDIPTLLDKRIEMIMKCYVDEPDGSQTVDLYMCPGTVETVVEDKLKVGRKTYTRGWAFVVWDGEEVLSDRSWWQHLRPSFFEKDKYGGWFVMEEGDGDGDARDGGSDIEEEDI
jgi:hypothetical protein